MRMKKTGSFLWAGILVLSLLTGCGGGAEKEPEKQGYTPALDTAQTAAFTIVGDLNNFEALEAVIAEFKTCYPNVEITYEKMDDYKNTLEMRLKNDPTVGCFIGYGSEKLSVDLNEYGYDTGAFGPIIEDSKKAGHLYGIPLGVNLSGLVVNATLLQKEGLKVPTKLSEWEEVCDALIKKGYTPVQQQYAAICRYLFEPYVWSRIDLAKDNEEQMKKLGSGEKGSMEPMRAVFDLYDSFVEKGYIDPEKNAAIKDNYEAAILNFFEGDVPFLPAIADTVSGMKKRESKSEAFTAQPFEYYFIYVPFAESGVYAEQQSWKNISVSKYCENRDLAVEFLKFMGTEENLNLLAATKGIPSAAAKSGDTRFAHINDAEGVYLFPWKYDVPYASWNSVIGRLIEYAAGEIATTDEALALIEQDVATE